MKFSQDIYMLVMRMRCRIYTRYLIHALYTQMLDTASTIPMLLSARYIILVTKWYSVNPNFVNIFLMKGLQIIVIRFMINIEVILTTITNIAVIIVTQLELRQWRRKKWGKEVRVFSLKSLNKVILKSVSI